MFILRHLRWIKGQTDLSPSRELSREDTLALLEELDNLLSSVKLVELVIGGGVAMTEWIDERRTTDVDVISEMLPRHIKDAAATIAERHGLPYSWLNDNAVGAAPPGIDHIGDIFFVGRCIKVSTPNAKCMLSMKLLSARGKDFRDALILAKETGIDTEEKLQKLFVAGYGSQHLNEKRAKFIKLVADNVST